MKCSALKPTAQNGTRCANGFLDMVLCARPDIRAGGLLPPCLREDQAPLTQRIDWQFLQALQPKQVSE